MQSADTTRPALARHRLRLELRRLREAAGLTQQRAAKALRWSASKLVRFEAGHSRISHTDLRALLDLYGVRDSGRRAELADLAEQGRRNPWNAYRDVLTAEQMVYLGCEEAATGIRAFQVHGVPDLFQTQEYARHFVRALDPDRTAGEVERIVETRTRRQQRLHRPDSPTVDVILDEAVLLRPPSVGGDAEAVLGRQVEHLEELAKLPHITIRVLPVDYGHHPGIANPFVIVDLPGDAGGVVYREGERANSILRESPDEVASHRRLFDRLAAATHPRLLVR